MDSIVQDDDSEGVLKKFYNLTSNVLHTKNRFYMYDAAQVWGRVLEYTVLVLSMKLPFFTAEFEKLSKEDRRDFVSATFPSQRVYVHSQTIVHYIVREMRHQDSSEEFVCRLLPYLHMSDDRLFDDLVYSLAANKYFKAFEQFMENKCCTGCSERMSKALIATFDRIIGYDEDVRIFKLIFEKTNFEINTKNAGRTPLSFAIEKYRPDLVELFLEHGARVDFYPNLVFKTITIQEFESFKFMAAGREQRRSDFILIVKKLLLNGPLPVIKAQHYCAIVHILQDDLPFLQEYLKTDNFLNRVCADRVTPLMWASDCTGKYALTLVKLLIDLGADVDQVVNETTALTCAALYNKNLEMTKCLLSNGANPFQILDPQTGETLINFAAQKKWRTLLRDIFDGKYQRQECDLPNFASFTPLHVDATYNFNKRVL